MDFKGIISASKDVGASERTDENTSPLNKAAELCCKKLRGNVGKAVVDYAMIEDGDKVMVCVSGGKDSFVILDTLLHLQRVA